MTGVRWAIAQLTSRPVVAFGAVAITLVAHIAAAATRRPRVTLCASSALCAAGRRCRHAVGTFCANVATKGIGASGRERWALDAHLVRSAHILVRIRAAAAAPVGGGRLAL
eukprot:7391830-Prymnesium_polylepis.1